MPFVAIVIDPVREFFTQAHATRTSGGYSPSQLAGVQLHFEAGRQRLSAGRRAGEAIPAALLLRCAVTHYLWAAETARDPGIDDEGLEAIDLASSMPSLPPDEARPTASPSDDERVRAALRSKDALYFDRLTPEDVERARWALDRAATMLRKRVEARSETNVRGTKGGRAAAIAVIVAYVAFVSIRNAVVPPDIALGKPVHVSSGKTSSPAGHVIVDGELGTSFGVHTTTEDSPNVVIDLLGDYAISTVKVYNRVDGWYDDSLPMVVELSRDGTTYEQIGRRDEHFGSDPPWIVDGHGHPARFIRIRVARKSYLALSQVQAFGKKL